MQWAVTPVIKTIKSPDRSSSDTGLRQSVADGIVGAQLVGEGEVDEGNSGAQPVGEGEAGEGHSGAQLVGEGEADERG